MSTGKRFFKFLLLFLLVFAIISLSKNAWGLINQGLVVKRKETELLVLREKNQQLKAWLDYVKTDEFLEQEARNNLGMVKGESVVILPSSFLADKIITITEDNLPAYQQWWNLFFR
jgi:cell division protein FtsB